MEKQEYQHIRNLAWDLLIDGHISRLPVDLNPIAEIYNLKNIIHPLRPRYENAILLSQDILKIYRYQNSEENSRSLAIRILAPMIVLKELNIQSPEDIMYITELPLQIAIQRFDRYLMLLKRDAFETSYMETRILQQFKPWIKSVKN